MQQLLDYIVQLIVEPREADVEFKFSAKKIIEALNIKREPREPLEGALFVNNLNQQKLITFNEDELKAFIASTVKNMEQLLSGVETRFTKVLNQKQVFVTFPLAGGMPFVYKYSEPTVLSGQGKSTFKIGTGKSGSLSNDLEFTFARNLDGSVGFLDTFGDVFATTGVINKLQIYIPAKLNTKIGTNEVKLNFVLPEQDVNLVHISVTPYTALQKRSSVLPVSEDPATKLIKRSTKVLSTDLNLGQLSGVAFQLQGYSYSSDYKNPSNLYDADILTNIRNFLYQKDIALTQFDLKYLAKDTKNKDVTYTVYFGKYLKFINTPPIFIKYILHIFMIFWLNDNIII